MSTANVCMLYPLITVRWRECILWLWYTWSDVLTLCDGLKRHRGDDWTWSVVVSFVFWASGLLLASPYLTIHYRPMQVPPDYRAPSALKIQGLHSDSGTVGLSFEFHQFSLFFCHTASVFASFSSSTCSFSSSFLRVCQTELEVCGGSVFERGETLT